MGAHASSFDHRQATDVALHNPNLPDTVSNYLFHQQQQRVSDADGSFSKQPSTNSLSTSLLVSSPIEICGSNFFAEKPSVCLLGRHSSLSNNNNNNNSSSSSSSSTTAAAAVALTTDFDFNHNDDDDNQFSGGSPYSRRRVQTEERDAVKPLSTCTATNSSVQNPQQMRQFSRGVSTTEIPNNINNSDCNNNNYEQNNTTSSKNSSNHKSSTKSSKKRSSSRSSIWQRFTAASSSSSSTFLSTATKSTSTVALNCHQQPELSEQVDQSHKNSVSFAANDAEEAQLINQPLRKRSLTESISLKHIAERRTRNSSKNNKQQPIESESSSNISSNRPATSHGSSGKQQSSIGSNARRAVAEGLSKLKIPFRNSARSSSSAEDVETLSKMAMKTAAVKSAVPTNSSASSNRPSSSSSSTKDAAPPLHSSDIPEVFTTSADEPPPAISPTSGKIPVFKLAAVPPPPPHHSSSTNTLQLAKDIEQLSLSSGSGSGAGSGGAGHHHSQAHQPHGNNQYVVHVGGGTRRNSRPRESPVHQARSNIIAENMQALLQTDATTGVVLQEHLSESHRGAIHTSMMSPTSNEAMVGSRHHGGGGGGGDYDLYYAAQAAQAATDAACQRDKFPVALSKPAAGQAAAGAVTAKKTAAPSLVAGSSGSNNVALKPFMSTGGGGLAIRRKSRTDEIRAYIAAGENAPNETNSILGDGATAYKLHQQQRHSEDLVTTTTTTTSLDDDEIKPTNITAADKTASAAHVVQSSDKKLEPSAIASADATTTSSIAISKPSTTAALPKIPAPQQKLIMSAEPQPMVAEMLNNQVWKRLTEKSMLQKSSSSDMLKCIGAFLHRRFAHLSHLFQPNEPVLWMRGVDRSLIAQGWQDMFRSPFFFQISQAQFGLSCTQAFLSPANIVFVYMLMRTLDGHVAGNLRQLQAHVLTALYVAYSYMGHEISYPVRLFLAADVEHKERFWLRCMRLVDDAGDNMLRINNDPLLFAALFHELIAHLRYIQPPAPPPPPPIVAPPLSPSLITLSQPSSSSAADTNTPSAKYTEAENATKTDRDKSVRVDASNATQEENASQTGISDVKDSNFQKSKLR